MKYFKLSILFLLFFAFSLQLFTKNAHSHGEGEEIILEKDGYKIDVGYSPEILYVNSPASFDFRISKGEEKIEFTDVWVRVSQGPKTFFASGIYNQNLGGSTLIYTFPQEGEYVLNVRYQKNGENIVEGEFPITVLVDPALEVEESSPLFSTEFILMGITALILGTILGIFIGRFTKILR